MAAPATAPPTIVVESAPPVMAEVHHTVPISGFTTVFGITINPMVMVLGGVFILLALITWQGMRRNSFNPWDLIQDVKDDGRRIASIIKTSFLSAFLVSTWVIVDQEIKGILSEGTFMAYLSVWGASLIAKVVFDKKEPMQLGLGK